jgi:MoaA/NifB/PqqE/SkfB family radical SAM enzyme
MLPNKRNFCGGAFPNWLEVNLTNKCNGRCSWCVEKIGYKPRKVVEYTTLVNTIKEHGAKNVILLGGEPTLYTNLCLIINDLNNNGHKIWITTNGSTLSKQFVIDNLTGLTGINISIHHYILYKNKDITGIDIKLSDLSDAISELHKHDISVRLNCNCISGYIDSVQEIYSYIGFAKIIGADKVRFAELKIDENNFVDLYKIFNGEYGLNENPFIYGCNIDVIIRDMPVNFRQMCGLQTTKRPYPENPEQIVKKVLYYDGILYNGWQIKGEDQIDNEKLREILHNVANKLITKEEAHNYIRKFI